MLDRAGGTRGQLNLEPPGRDKDLLRSAHNVPLRDREWVGDERPPWGPP